MHCYEYLAERYSLKTKRRYLIRLLQDIDMTENNLSQSFLREAKILEFFRKTYYGQISITEINKKALDNIHYLAARARTQNLLARQNANRVQKDIYEREMKMHVKKINFLLA